MEKRWWTVNEPYHLHSDIPFKNGKRHGTAKTYNRDGKVCKEDDYVDGKQVGKSRFPLRNGS